MLHTDIDTVLCVLWTIAYTLTLVGTRKYKYPLIPPMAQLFIASLEFSMFFSLIVNNVSPSNHVFWAYLFWTILEIAIIVAQIRYGFIRKKDLWPYLVAIVALSFCLCYLIAFRGYELFFTLFNTVLGEMFWLIHIHKKEYPMKPIAFFAFLAKFLADAMSVPVYFGRGSWFESFMGILIPAMDFFFIHIYFSRIANAANSVVNQCDSD